MQEEAEDCGLLSQSESEGEHNKKLTECLRGCRVHFGAYTLLIV